MHLVPLAVCVLLRLAASLTLKDHRHPGFSGALRVDNNPTGDIMDGVAKEIGKSIVREAPDLAKEVTRGMQDEIKEETSEALKSTVDRMFGKAKGRQAESETRKDAVISKEKENNESVSGAFSGLVTALGKVLQAITSTLSAMFQNLMSIFLPYETDADSHGRQKQDASKSDYPVPKEDFEVQESAKPIGEPSTKDEDKPWNVKEEISKGLESIKDRAYEKIDDIKESAYEKIDEKKLEIQNKIEEERNKIEEKKMEIQNKIEAGKNWIGEKKEDIKEAVWTKVGPYVDPASACGCDFPCWIDDDGSTCFTQCCGHHPKAVVPQQQTGPIPGQGGASHQGSSFNPLEAILDKLKRPAPQAAAQPWGQPKQAPHTPQAAPALPSPPQLPNLGDMIKNKMQDILSKPTLYNNGQPVH